jgi:hypothetical protein
LPLAIELGPGNEHDSKKFEKILGGIKIVTEQGRPRTRPEEVNADAAYDERAIRNHLRRRGIKSNIPVNERNRKTPKVGRPTRFNGESYKLRGSIERFFGWIKTKFRRLVIRYERLNSCFWGLIIIAVFLIYWRRIYD